MLNRKELMYVSLVLGVLFMLMGFATIYNFSPTITGQSIFNSQAVCDSLQINETSEFYLIDNCAYQIKIAKIEQEISGLSYDSGSTTKNLTAYPGDIIGIGAAEYNDENQIFLNRIVLTYGATSLSGQNGAIINLIVNKSNRITVEVVSEDSQMRISREITLHYQEGNLSDIILERYNIENIGGSTVTDLVFYKYVDTDLTTETNQETRDKLNSFRCADQSKIQSIVQENYLTSAVNKAYGNCYYIVQGDRQGNRNGGTFAVNPNSYFATVQVKSDDSEIPPNPVGVNSEGTSQTDVAVVQIYNISSIGVGESISFISGSGVQEDPDHIWFLINVTLNLFEVTISDPRILVDSVSVNNLSQDSKFNASLDLTNNGNNTFNSAALRVLIYDSSFTVFENSSYPLGTINPGESRNDYLIAEYDTLGWGIGSYTLDIRLLNVSGHLQDTVIKEFQILPSLQFYAISLSNDLAAGIYWNLTNLPVFELGAEGNNLLGFTDYEILVEAFGTDVDLYLRASGDLQNAGGETIPLSNEKYAYNLSDSQVPSDLRSISTNYSDSPIGKNMVNASKSYLKFYLDVSGGQEAGLYNNTVEIKAVISGGLP